LIVTLVMAKYNAFLRIEKAVRRTGRAVRAIMLSMASSDASRFPLDQETEAAIREGLAQAERGEFVPDEVVAESNKRHGI
jgi:predicted transcriptional regulator